ncbi:MAG: ABC transporter permease, partial [Alphaproteobacteria bacterium]|nr:ABC transporter permease [Alphaproteobacteria bacterium]
MTRFIRLSVLSQNPNRLYLAQCLLFLAALGIGFSWASPSFLSLANISNILTASAVIGLMALGTTFVIASGAIDLSSAAVMALSGTMAAYAVQQGLAASPAAAAFVAVATGSLCGLLTGFLINVTKAPSFIVTLGMMSVARAAAFIVSDGKPFYGLPENIVNAGQGKWMGMPIHVALLLLGALFGFVVLAKTKFGAHTLIMGDNPPAAE